MNQVILPASIRRIKPGGRHGVRLAIDKGVMLNNYAPGLHYAVGTSSSIQGRMIVIVTPSPKVRNEKASTSKMSNAWHANVLRVQFAI